MDIGHILSSVPPIVDNIFQHLSLRDLESCSHVCDLWKRVAETEKNRRDYIVCFYQGLHCSLYKEIHSSAYECSFDTIRNIENDLSMQLKDLKMKPNFCLTFATNPFVCEFERLFPTFEFFIPSSREPKDRQRARLKAAIHSAIGQYLPEKCPISFSVSNCIVCCRGDYLPLEIEFGCGISGILIRHVPGLKIYHLPIEEKTWDVSKLVPEGTSIKCLLLFPVTHNRAARIRNSLRALLKENSQIAVGGAVVTTSESPQGSVVAFCGQSVEAASIIIEEKVGEAELEKKLEQFKKTGLLQYRCFAFMLVADRGFFKHEKYNLESSIFHKLYPDVPFIGIWGKFAIGIDCLPNISNVDENEVLSKKYSNCEIYNYTTIFVLVSVKL